MKKSKIVIFKNDRIGDLMYSIDPLKHIILQNKDKEIILYLSKINYLMKFIFEEETNVTFKQIGYHPSLYQKLSILINILKNKVEKIYIFSPKLFYFILPILFFYKKIKYYALCVDSIDGYKRPGVFLRKFLHKYVINDRSTKKIRRHTTSLQKELVSMDHDLEYKKYNFKKNLDFFELLPEKYLLIHFKKLMYDEVKWSINDFVKLIEKLENRSLPIIVIKDMGLDKYTSLFKNKFDYINITTKEKKLTGKKTIFVDDLSGINFFNIIANAYIVIGPHGTITSIANYCKVNVVDMFYYKINSISDFYDIKNAFHEFIKKSNNYNFTSVNKNCHKTINKIDRILNKYE